MNLMPFFKEYMKNYEGLDDYLVKIDGQSMYEWNYEDGCLFVGASRLYELTGDREYLDFIVKMVSPYIEEDGTIKSYHREEYNLDFINAGKIFYFLYDETGEERYRKACDTLMTQLIYQPRLTTGNFWHKKIYPHQIWLDGLYMAQPFYMQYEAEYNGCKNCEDSYQQFLQVYGRMRDPLNGLYYHAYDDSRQMFWCDKVTGLSENFWLRAMGWYAMALIDTMEVMPESMACQKARLNAIYKELIDAMLPYQDQATGMWYQVVNRGGIAPNYLEESGSAIFAYAIMKSVRLHYLPEEYFKYGQKAFDGICSTYLSEKDGSLQLGGICLVAGLGNTDMREGTFEYYMREPVVENEAKGIAPLILAYIETMFRCQS